MCQVENAAVSHRWKWKVSREALSSSFQAGKSSKGSAKRSSFSLSFLWGRDHLKAFQDLFLTVSKWSVSTFSSSSRDSPAGLSKSLLLLFFKLQAKGFFFCNEAAFGFFCFCSCFTASDDVFRNFWFVFQPDQQPYGLQRSRRRRDGRSG